MMLLVQSWKTGDVNFSKVPSSSNIFFSHGKRIHPTGLTHQSTCCYYKRIANHINKCEFGVSNPLHMYCMIWILSNVDYLFITNRWETMNL